MDSVSATLELLKLIKIALKSKHLHKEGLVKISSDIFINLVWVRKGLNHNSLVILGFMVCKNIPNFLSYLCHLNAIDLR